MNLKALMEKRNELLSKADTLVSTAEVEVRSLSTEEKTMFDSLTAELETINSEINKSENLRKEGEKIDMEERNMDNIMEKEVRGLEQYVRGIAGEEVRELQVTTNGGAVIPENVEGTIVLKMEETSPVFAKARKFPSVSGTLKIAKETANAVAGFVGEGADVQAQAISLGEVKLTQKRVGAALSLSNQLINDAAINIVDYSIGLLSRRCAKAVEKSIFTGSTDDEFRGIIGNAEIASTAKKTADGITIDILMDVYNSVHPDFLDGASWYMARSFFNLVAKLKDANGHFYLQNGVVNGKLTYTLFGAEVIVSDALTFNATATTGTGCIFGSIADSYGVMVKRGFALQHVVADTTQALRGSQLLVLDGYMDGEVFNPQALAKLVYTAV